MSTAYDTMANCSPSLPTEVCERIINFLHEDQKSLHSCLLTCRNWVPRAHYHLYSCVRLSTPTGLSLFLRCLDSFPENVQFVHCLRLRGCPYHWPPAKRNKSDELMVTAAIRLPGILTSLREIEIIELPENMHPTFPRRLSQFHTTTQLTLKSAEFTSFSEFRRPILAFPSLKRLYLINTTWRGRRQPITSPIHRPSDHTRSRPALEYVKIYYEHDGDEELVDLINWLLTTVTRSTLVELSVGRLDTEMIPTLNDLLSGCRNSLHTLEIYCNDYKHNQRFETINLSNNLALRDLRMYDIDATSFSSLLLVALPPLRSLSIRLLSDSELDDGHAWKMVASALSYGHLHNVENIRIGLADITNKRRRCEFRAVSKYFELHPRVVFTDYLEDDVQPYNPKYYEAVWIDKLKDLSRRLGRSDALATSMAKQDGVRTVIYTVSGMVYGRGTGRTHKKAKQMAAYPTYFTWLTELCACSPDEYRHKYSHIFK